MNDVEDSLKAVEEMTEIVRDLLTATPVFYPGKAEVIERLNSLRMGCEALRAGARGSGSAQKILGRPLPGALPKESLPCADLRKSTRECLSHPGLSFEEKRILNPLAGAAEGCDECLVALVDQIRGASNRP